MSDDNEAFDNLFGSEDEASDIDDGRSPASQHSDEGQAAPSPTFGNSHAAADTDDDDDDDDVLAGRRKRGKTTKEDLFGSDEDEDDDDIPSTPLKKLKRADQMPSVTGLSDVEESPRSPASLGSADDDDEADFEDKPQQKIVEENLSLPALAIPSSIDDKYYLAKLPRFLEIEQAPFDPNTLQLQVEEDATEEEQLESIRKQVEATMRWRVVEDALGQESYESNAHIVEWEDGTKSLMVGEECFDVVTKNMAGREHAFLLAHQTENGALESHTQFTDHMTFQPSDLRSMTHRHLTAEIAGKHVKKTRTKVFFTEMDPEKQKMELEEQENERLRAAKRLDAKRRRAEMQFDLGPRTSRRMEEEEEELGIDSYVDNEEDDDFVVDDDAVDEEEELRREQRLANVKSSGMDKYRRQAVDDEEEEEEEEEEMDEEEEEDEVVVRRHKRRQQLDSDED
ncbi:Leo1-like protein-domain-containing protein [Gongronella butleri]|nr:Leo1-like protein-domain-containing protein [Gongronella butleri]